MWQQCWVSLERCRAAPKSDSPKPACVSVRERAHLLLATAPRLPQVDMRSMHTCTRHRPYVCQGGQMQDKEQVGGVASHRSVGLRLPAAASAKHTGPLQRMVSHRFHGSEYGKSTEAEVSAQTVQEQPGIKMHSPARQRPPLLQQILCALPFRVLVLLVCGNIQIKLRDKNINANARFNCGQKL